MAKKRSEFENTYKWNTKHLYASQEEVMAEITNLENKIKEYAKYENHILDSATTLLDLLNLDKEVGMHLERLYIYGHINNDADTKDVYYQELFGKIQNVYTKYLQATAFIVPELLKSDFKVIEKYLKTNVNLKEYTRLLKDIYRHKEHILSGEVEKALSSYAKLMSAPDEIMGTLTDSDLKFSNIIVDGKEVELTESNYSVYLRHPNREVRKQAFLSLYKTYGDFKNTLAVILRCQVEKDVTSANLHKFNNSLEAALFSNEIDPQVYHNLIECVHHNLEIIYEYWDLKKKMLKLDQLHLYDTYADVPLKDDTSYSFEEAKDLVLKAVAPLGDNYKEVITSAFTDGWIDSVNNEGKRGGAYCTACYSVHPYVLLSYEGKLNDVSTLAHELGHAMHYYYACKYQSYEDYNYSIFVAEVASQVNEILLCRYLLDNSQDKGEKLRIIDDLLQKFKSTIYRQTMFAEFELFIHEFTEAGNVLTYQNMCDKYYDLNKLYFGNKVIIDDEIKYEWERIPHFYMNFYVYQYATGFAAAVYLANKIYAGDKKVRDKYLEFLQLGCTKNPIDSLKVAGVDMTNAKVIDEALGFMKDLIKEYRELLGSEEDGK